MPQINEVTQVGKREDLSDQLIVADAKSTPLTSMMPKGKKPAKTIFDWPHARIPDPDTTPVPDGKPVDNVEDGSGDRALLHGRIQKLRRVVGVSEFAEDVSTPAGVQSEFANAKANMLIAVKRAIEAVFCGDQDSSLVGNTHSTRALGVWLNSTAPADGGCPIPANFRTPAASIYSGALTDMTEDNLRSLMQSGYTQTGQMIDWDALVGTDLKAYVSKFTMYDPTVSGKTIVRTFFTKLEDETLDATVDIVKGDFGKMRLTPTLWNNWNNTTKAADTKRGYLLAIKGIRMRANRLPGFKPLPEDDSGPKGVISTIIAQQVDSPLVHGQIRGT